MGYPRKKPRPISYWVRKIVDVRERFPDTPLVDLPARDRALTRRRAKNRRGRASRRANR